MYERVFAPLYSGAMATTPDPAGHPNLIAQAIAAGERACILLDDSSGSTDPQYPQLEKGRKLWAGVALHPEAAKAVQQALRLSEMTNLINTGRKAVHFTEMVGRQGRYKDLPSDARIMIVESLGDLLLQVNAYVCIFQMKPSTVKSMQAAGHELWKVPGLDTSDPDSGALYNCLQVLKMHAFEASGYEGLVSAVADRWRGKEYKVLRPMKNGEDVDTWLWPRGIAFMSVEEFPMLQMADLVAWTYSRLELESVRGIQNEYEEALIETLKRVSQGWRVSRPTPDGQFEFPTISETVLP